MLIETLNINGIDVVSANTDGVIVHTNRNNLALIRTLYAEWSNITGFNLEETNYTRYIRRDINNYLTVKPSGEIKAKGIFVPQLGILKGYDKPIVAIALQEYFLKGVPVEDVIRNIGYKYHFTNPEVSEDRVTDIYDYTMAQKVGSTFHHAALVDDDGTHKIQRSLRYYASNTGGSLFKVKQDGDVMSYHNMLISSKITLFNDYADGPYDINYDYYINEAMKIISLIEGKEWIDKAELKESIEKKLVKKGQRVLTLANRWQDYVDRNKTHLKAATITKELLNSVEKEYELLQKQLEELNDNN